jgi:hypothetical protein
MTRLRLTLADNEGRKSASEHEHSYDLPGGLPRFVDIEAAVAHCKQQALPELAAELLTRAPRQCVAEVTKGVSCSVMGRGTSPCRRSTERFSSKSNGARPPTVQPRRPIWS